MSTMFLCVGGAASDAARLYHRRRLVVRSLFHTSFLRSYILIQTPSEPINTTKTPCQPTFASISLHKYSNMPSLPLSVLTALPSMSCVTCNTSAPVLQPRHAHLSTSNKLAIIFGVLTTLGTLASIAIAYQQCRQNAAKRNVVQQQQSLQHQKNEPDAVQHVSSDASRSLQSSHIDGQEDALNTQGWRIVVAGLHTGTLGPFGSASLGLVGCLQKL